MFDEGLGCRGWRGGVWAWGFVLLGVLPGGAVAQDAAAPVTAPPVTTAPANRTFLYQGEATSILGRQVHDPAGELVGRIVDVLVGDGGLPRAAVIDFGGFLGVGNRRVAVSWTALRFDPAARAITIEMTVGQIRAIPQFRQPVKPADPPVSVALPPAVPVAPVVPAAPAPSGANDAPKRP